MAERQAASPPEEPRLEAGGAAVPPPRLAPPPEPDPEDDAPTIISKNPPSAAIAEAFQNSLRGRTLAHFELLEPIGVGGMAAVIRARDQQLDRMVALKILPPETAVDPENVRRFHQEARAAAKLDHENIARVFFCGEDQRLHFIAFEYVEGTNLRLMLERRGRLPAAEAVHYMLQIAAGLAHAAARGVVHRDIKPSNIIISPNGRAKLVDMGLARSQERRDDQGLTQSGVTLGTFDYISPEQALEPREADVRSDIYSLGCTFYHMVTGSAPVPEGTAAKKLHHHQHVAPIDPRQLNPEIPDEIAAILARMMAKDPRERYQRPEHLVQHLIVAAQKVGASAEVPDGVLFVDAPLPNPPERRPWLMGILAAGVLAVLLLVLSLGQPPAAPVTLPRPEVDARAEQLSPTRAATPAPVAAATSTKKEVSDEKSFHDAFAGPLEDRTVLVVNQRLELTSSGPVFHGQPNQALLVESLDPDFPATICLKAAPSGEQAELWAALVVDGGKLTFRNIRFEIEVKQTPEAARVAGVAVRRDSIAVFERCTFVQKAPSRRGALVPVASVSVLNPDEGEEGKPLVVFNECYFQEGQDAIAVHGAADLRPTNCAFGKHSALFHLRATRKAPADLRLLHCSAFVVRGPAFRLDGEATCRLSIKDSIFSCPDEAGTTSLQDQPHLIRQTEAATRAVRYEGERNCYHNLNALWVLPQAEGPDRIIVDLPDFLTQVRQAGGRDVGSSVLLARDSPWDQPDPLGSKPAEAFQINPKLPQLREPNSQLALGVTSCVWGAVYPQKLPPLPSPAPSGEAVALDKKTKIVDPSASMSKDQVYPTLAGALEDARPGDEILIKQGSKDRLVEVSPLRIRPDLTLVTLKPYPGDSPVLTLASNTDEEDAALFRLNSGQLKLEQLEFLLKPDRPGFKAQTVVALKGNGQCSFKQCVITFAEEAAGTHLCLATLLDTRDAMKMPARDLRQAPEIQLDGCLVRGEGDGLSVRASRPFELTAENCIVALTGSLVNVEGNATEPQAPTPAHVRLDRVTTYLTEHLLQLRAGKNGKGLVPTSVTAAHCLFASAGSKAFIYLDGLDGEKQMKELFFWEGRHNAYDGFDKFLDQQPTGESMVMWRYDQEKWRMFANESDPQPLFVRARCFELAERPLSQLGPADFHVRGDMRLQLLTYGCTLTADSLPHASVAESPAPETTEPQ